ncbi:sensor histidine kinase [Maricaulis sp. W15]|uniref:sensor histidine kinase n=1 Tax=Maricaulis sp. W15 TaxID=1772333 RepID=UPI0009FABC63|nr:sensor histidine kinase [Maricaulis sp. W15]
MRNGGRGLRSTVGLRLQLLGVLALSLLPLLLLAIAQGVVEFRSEVATQRDRLYAAGAQATEEFGAVLERAAGVASAIAAHPQSRLLHLYRCEVSLQSIATADPVYVSVRMIDPGGAVTCAATTGPERISEADQEWFDRLSAGVPEVFSHIQTSPKTGEPVIVAAHEIRDRGELVGAVALSVDVRTALGRVDISGFPASFALGLSDSEGNRVGLAEAETPLPTFELSPEQLNQARERGGPVTLRSSDAHTVMITPLAGEGIYLVVHGPTVMLDGWAGFDLVGTVLIPVLMWVMALVSVGFATDVFILRWISYLGRFARLYGAGRLDAQPVKASGAPSEVRAFAETMASMASALNERTLELERRVDERGALLREIHHRVKNNLQIIISLINIQAGRATDPVADEVLREMRGRINALAMIHRTLYEADDLRSVDMGEFLDLLASQLAAIASQPGRDIRLTTQVEPVVLEPDQAIPVALFVTEAVTNAYKHAFNARDEGEVLVALSRETDGSGYRVVIEDDGPGPDKTSGTSPGGGTGSSLMEAFAMQLGGRFVRETAGKRGCRVSLSFPAQADGVESAAKTAARRKKRRAS